MCMSITVCVCMCVVCVCVCACVCVCVLCTKMICLKDGCGVTDKISGFHFRSNSNHSSLELARRTSGSLW